MSDVRMRGELSTTAPCWKSEPLHRATCSLLAPQVLQLFDSKAFEGSHVACPLAHKEVYNADLQSCIRTETGGRCI